MKAFDIRDLLFQSFINIIWSDLQKPFIILIIQLHLIQHK